MNIKRIMLCCVILILPGCASPLQQVPVNVIVSPQKALLRPCKVTPVGELGSDFESAFYAVSDAYMKTSGEVTKCNSRLKAAEKQIEQTEAIYDNTKTK